MTLDDLTVNFSHLNREDILSDWVWLTGDAKLPILLSASGDAFLQDTNDGYIYWLDTATAELFKVADNADEFQSLLSDKEFVVNHLSVNMVGDLIKNNITLDQGQIYSYKQPPVLGGEYALQNVEAIDVLVHFSFSGQIHEQVKDLPKGTKVNDIKLEIPSS